MKTGAIHLCSTMALLAGACGGIRSNPLVSGQRSGDGAPPDGGLGGERTGPPQLSGGWTPCARLGTGGPIDLALASAAPVEAVLFSEGQLALQSLPGHAPLRVIEGARGDRVALSPDGARVAVAGAGGVSAWDVADGGPLFQAPGAYTNVAFAPDGQTLLARATAPADVLELRDAGDGALVHTFAADGADLRGFAFSADGGQVGLYHHATLTWYQADAGGATVRDVAVAAGATVLAAMSPNGRTLALVDASNTTDLYGDTIHTYELGVYETAEGRLLWSQIGMFDSESAGASLPPPPTLLFSAEGDAIIASSATEWLYVLAADSGAIVPELANSWSGGPLEHVGMMAASRFNGALLVADRSGVYSVSNQDPTVLRRVPSLAGQGLPIAAAAFSSDGRRLAVSSIPAFDTLYPLSPTADTLLWDMTAPGPPRVFAGVDAASLTFSPGDLWLLVSGGTDTGAFSELALQGSDRSDHVAPAWLSRYGADGRTIFTNTLQGVAVLPADQQVQLHRFAGSLAFPGFDLSPDGATIATSGPALWRLSDAALIWSGSSAVQPGLPLQHDLYAPMADNWVRFAPDGATILVSDVTVPPYGVAASLDATNATTTRLFSAADGHLVTDFGAAMARRPVFSADGAWIAAGDVVTSVADQRTVTLPLARSRATVSAFASNGTIAVGRADGVIEVFCPL